MRYLIYVIFFFVMYMIMFMVRKSTRGSNTTNEKKSDYYNVSAEEAERRFEYSKWAFRYVPRVLAVVLFIIALLIVNLTGLDPAVRLAIAMLMLMLILMSLILMMMGLYSNKNINVILERDCDVVKGRRVLELRLNEMPSRHFATSKYKSVYLCEIAHSYVLSSDSNWENMALDYINQARSKYPKIENMPSYHNVMLKLGYRQGNINTIDSSIRMLSDLTQKAFKATAPILVNGLLEEAQIHRYMVNKEYDQAIPMIEQHFKHGDCPLAYVYLHYYMAEIYLSRGDEQSALTHINYLRNNGGNTYYLGDLKERYDI